MRRPAPGFTLIEMIVVVAIMVALAGVVIPMLDNHKTNAADTVSRANLNILRDAIATYVNDTGKWPLCVGDLFRKPDALAPYNPISKIGWNGPYLNTAGDVYDLEFGVRYNQDRTLDALGKLIHPDPAIKDTFSRAGKSGMPIVLQIDFNDDGTIDSDDIKYARLVSAGPDGTLDTPADHGELTVAEKANDDLVLYLRVQVAP